MPTSPDRALQLPARALAQRRVEVRERLVEQQDARVRRERPGEGDALLLAAGDLGHAPVLEPREPGERERLGDARGRSAARRAPAALEPEGDVLADGHVREERVVLEDHAEAAALGRGGRDVLAVDEDAPRVGRLEAGDQPQHRRLAAAGGTEERDDLALRRPTSETPRVTGVLAEALLEALEASGNRPSAAALFTRRAPSDAADEQDEERRRHGEETAPRTPGRAALAREELGADQVGDRGDRRPAARRH